jgi:hypothetical protein
MEHIVVQDYAGVFESLYRLTCYTCKECTLVKQPYMGLSRWNQELGVFKKLHPHQETISWEEYKKTRKGENKSSFEFTIRSENYQGKPWRIEQDGKISDEDAINKTGECYVNKVRLFPCDRVTCTGSTHGKDWFVTLDWDGCDLTVFPEPEYMTDRILEAESEW